MKRSVIPVSVWAASVVVPAVSKVPEPSMVGPNDSVVPISVGPGSKSVSPAPTVMVPVSVVAGLEPLIARTS